VQISWGHLISVRSLQANVWEDSDRPKTAFYDRFTQDHSSFPDGHISCSRPQKFYVKRCHSHSYSFSIMEMYGYKNEIIPLSNWLIAVLSTSPFTIIHRTYRAGQPNPAILDLLLSQNRLQGWVQVDSNVLQPVTPVTPVTKTVPPGHPGQIITMECISTLMCIWMNEWMNTYIYRYII